MTARAQVATQRDTVETRAQRFLRSAFLCERARRVDSLAAWISGFSDFEDVACHRRAVHAAAWLHDGWCVSDVVAGRFDPALVLAVEPTEWQRERAADLALDLLKDVVDDATRQTTRAIIRAAGVPDTGLPEARILAEAVNLDSMGPLWLWGQVARCAAENRPIASVIAAWERQVEYRYWERRISQTLRFDRSRRLARQRCAGLEAYLQALRDQWTGGDRFTVPETLP